MKGRWSLTKDSLSMVIDRAEFEAELERAVAWQFEFDHQVEAWHACYRDLSRWRRAVYRWFGIGLGREASNLWIRHKVIKEPESKGSK